MKRFLVYQQVVESQELGNSTIDVYIRNVGADSNAEAIGKFILAMSEKKCVKKFDPICFELDTLTKID